MCDKDQNLIYTGPDMVILEVLYPTLYNITNHPGKFALLYKNPVENSKYSKTSNSNVLP